MSVGEQAVITVPPEFAYGAKGECLSALVSLLLCTDLLVQESLPTFRPMPR